MSGTGSFGEVEHATITILVDNRADALARSTARVQYADALLLAEHGFSALVQLHNPDLTILWDAGATGIALTENLRRLKVDPGAPQMIALSHGHKDHTGGLSDILQAMSLSPKRKEWNQPLSADEIDRWIEGHRIPVVIHPAALRERWRAKPHDVMVGPDLPPPCRVWEGLGAQVVYSEGPYQLASGCWTTGYVPRRSFEASVNSQNRFYREGDALLPDLVDDDQALVIHVAGQGLVIVAGCAHAGIVNTVNNARELTGIDEVLAVLGGFHLSGAKEEEIEETILRLAAFHPGMIVPCHCTGLGAMSQFASQMPEAFIEGVVGARFAW